MLKRSRSSGTVIRFRIPTEFGGFRAEVYKLTCESEAECLQGPNFHFLAKSCSRFAATKFRGLLRAGCMFSDVGILIMPTPRNAAGRFAKSHGFARIIDFLPPRTESRKSHGRYRSLARSVLRSSDSCAIFRSARNHCRMKQLEG